LGVLLVLSVFVCNRCVVVDMSISCDSSRTVVKRLPQFVCLAIEEGPMFSFNVVGVRHQVKIQKINKLCHSVWVFLLETRASYRSREVQQYMHTYKHAYTVRTKVVYVQCFFQWARGSCSHAFTSVAYFIWILHGYATGLRTWECAPEGAVHKVRHAIFHQFLPTPPPVTLCHTSRNPPKYVTHLGPP